MQGRSPNSQQPVHNLFTIAHFFPVKKINVPGGFADQARRLGLQIGENNPKAVSISGLNVTLFDLHGKKKAI